MAPSAGNHCGMIPHPKKLFLPSAPAGKHQSKRPQSISVYTEVDSTPMRHKKQGGRPRNYRPLSCTIDANVSQPHKTVPRNYKLNGLPLRSKNKKPSNTHAFKTKPFRSNFPSNFPTAPISWCSFATVKKILNPPATFQWMGGWLHSPLPARSTFLLRFYYLFTADSSPRNG